MKITFDLDGTLLKYPNELLSFAFFMRKAGHQVGILSGHGMWHLRDNVIPALEKVGFKPDFYIGRDFEPTESNWDHDIKNQVWKPKMLEQHNIDIHFDDQIEGDIGVNNSGAKIIKV